LISPIKWTLSSFLLFQTFLSPYPGHSEVLLKTIPSNGVGTGKTLTVLVESSIPLSSVRASFMGRVLPLFPAGKEMDRFRQFFGISLKGEEAFHTIRIMAMDMQGNPLEAEDSIKVFITSYPRERIAVVPEKRHLLTSSALDEENKVLNDLLSRWEPEKLWSGRFLMPVKGRITSPFGIHRIYNDGMVAWQHRGVDLSGNEGKIIRAPNSGRIAMTSDFVAHGKTIVIDHGQGIFSIMIHLSAFYVREGQMVKKGDQVGSIGKTGLASVPHLHWGMSVGGERIDPMEWIEKSMDKVALERK